MDNIESNLKLLCLKLSALKALLIFVLSLNFLLKIFFAPLFDENSVMRRIERMLSVDSLCIEDKSDARSSYDQEKIAQFEKGILIKNNQVHIELVWHDNVLDVPSNH